MTTVTTATTTAPELNGTGRERGLVALDSYLAQKTVVVRVRTHEGAAP